MPRIVIAGGGTGGHVFPALAIARALLDRIPGCEVVMVGTERGLEARVVPQAGFRLLTIPVAGLKGKSLVSTARGLFMLPSAFAASWGILSREKPSVVLGVGGYASGPIVAVAAMRRIPTLIHEQNMTPGSTNRWLAPFVSAVAVTFPETVAALGGRGVVTGNPVRSEFAAIPARPKGRPAHHLLIFGGSQGSAAINRAVADALPHLMAFRDRLRVVHQTGEAGAAAMREAYGRAGFHANVRPFIEAMAHEMNDADLIVARAGATTVAELSAAGRAAIFVPLPTAIHDHQTHNAKTIERAGAAVVIPQAELIGEILASAISRLLSSEERLDAMAAAAKSMSRPDAAARIADLASGLIDGRGRKAA